jgi:hypothetical protein
MPNFAVESSILRRLLKFTDVNSPGVRFGVQIGRVNRRVKELDVSSWDCVRSLKVRKGIAQMLESCLRATALATR